MFTKTTVDNKNNLNTENTSRDKFNIYREAVQNGEYITFEYDGNIERKSRLREKLRNI